MFLDMARPLSDAKRNAILATATSAIAASGLAASTKAIARDAGVGEGTLFVYFPTKDDLFCELYLELKADLTRAIAADYPKNEDVQTRLKHLWDHFVRWGLKNPEKRDALRRLAVSEKVSQVKDHAENETCASMASMIEADLSSGLLRVQPIEFVSGTIQALGDMVTEMIARDRAKADEYLNHGWQTLWGAISAR
jgi:AcrR family transcriptional regulator